MAWPPVSGVSAGFTIEAPTTGVSSVRWGTEGLITSIGGAIAASGYYVITRFDQKELVDVVKLPQGSGLTAGRVRIKDGVQWSITVRDDTAMTAPKVGSGIIIVDAAGSQGAVGLKYAATVVDNDYQTAVKQPGERVLIAENLVLMESQTGA